MKLKKLLCGCVVAGLFAACSNEIPGEEGKILENETTTYVKLSLVSPGSGTRAAEYEYGSSDESEVKSILLTFFDAGRNYVGRTYFPVDEKDIQTETGTTNTVEKILTIVKSITLPESSNYPRYVVAYVNPTSAWEDLMTDKLEDNMRIIRNRSTISPNGQRTMNNSVYFNETTGYVRYATDVDFHNQFFTSEADAKAAKEDQSIVITVERMEAKVRMNTDVTKIPVTEYSTESDIDTDAKYTLEFVPQSWFVNATEKRSFLIKNFRSSRTNISAGNVLATDYGLSLSELKTAFNDDLSDGDKRSGEVNEATNLRCYWAIDPTYFELGTSIYPSVSYDVKYEDVNTNKKDFPLLYRSYAKVMEEQNNAKNTNYVKFTDRVKTHEYVLENTMDRQTLLGNDAMASMSSVVVLGYYKVKDATTGNVVFDGNDETINKNGNSFYIRHEADNKKYVFVSHEEAMDYFLERGGSTLFVQSINDDGTPIANTYKPLRAPHIKDGRYGVGYDDFELVYPGTDVTVEGRAMSEQWRTLRIKKKSNGTFSDKIFIYDADTDNGNGGYKNITAADEKLVNSRLYSTFGVIEKFQTGKAYFNVPLKHIWGANGTSNKFDAQSVHLGDYGVVRNHIYDLTINKITGLGTGIGDINQPIVPPTDNDQYYISAKLRILQWRLVKQSIDL